MRKPIEVKEIKKRHREQLKKVSKKNPIYEQRMRIRQNKEIGISIEKNYNFNEVSKIKRNEKRITKTLYNNTKSKLKGKSRKQISKIWNSYNKKKDSIHLKSSNKVVQFIPSSSLITGKLTRTHVKEEYFTIKGKNPNAEILKLLKQNIDRKPTYMLVILTGVDSMSGDEVIISDSFSNVNMKDIIKNNDNIFDEIKEGLQFKKSGDNFQLKNINIRLIYDIR